MNQQSMNNLPPAPGNMNGNLPPNMTPSGQGQGNVNGNSGQPARGIINLTRNRRNPNQGPMPGQVPMQGQGNPNMGTMNNMSGNPNQGQGNMPNQAPMQGQGNPNMQNRGQIDIEKRRPNLNMQNMDNNPNMPNMGVLGNQPPMNRQPMNNGAPNMNSGSPNMNQGVPNGYAPNPNRNIKWNVKNAIGTRKNIEVIDTFRDNGIKVDVMEYQKLLSPRNPAQAMNLTFMQKENLKVRQLAIYVENSAVQLQAGAMSYFQGPLEMISGVTLGNAIGRMFAGSVTGEAMAKPVYSGSGLVVSEPSFRHFFGIMLRPGESVVVDKGMFYMAANTVKVEPALQENMSSALFGKEGWFQLRLTGPGLAVCECAVCKDEIDIIELNNDILRVDGNFAILRTAGISFSVEKSAKTLVGSAASGEGLVNVYKGTGQVWLAPTIKIYGMI